MAFPQAVLKPGEGILAVLGVVLTDSIGQAVRRVVSEPSDDRSRGRAGAFRRGMHDVAPTGFVAERGQIGGGAGYVRRDIRGRIGVSLGENGFPVIVAVDAQ